MTIAIITFILLLSVHVIMCTLYVRMGEMGGGVWGGSVCVDDAYMHFRFENENKSRSYMPRKRHQHTYNSLHGASNVQIIKLHEEIGRWIVCKLFFSIGVIVWNQTQLHLFHSFASLSTRAVGYAKFCSKLLAYCGHCTFCNRITHAHWGFFFVHL